MGDAVFGSPIGGPIFSCQKNRTTPPTLVQEILETHIRGLVSRPRFFIFRKSDAPREKIGRTEFGPIGTPLFGRPIFHFQNIGRTLRKIGRTKLEPIREPPFRASDFSLDAPQYTIGRTKSGTLFRASDFHVRRIRRTNNRLRTLVAWESKQQIRAAR